MIRIDSTNQIVSEGCLVSIIDFSLSRLQSGRRLLYSDLSADEWLFNADAGKSKQYDVYRRMKSLIKEDWSGFYPQTNLFWLEYVTETLLSRLPASKQKSKVGLEITEFLKSDCTKYESCQDLISKGMNGMYKY